MFLVWINEIFSLKRLIVLFLAINQLQKTGSSVHNQSLREKHAFSVEFLLVYRSVLRWRSNTHVGFLFWLWPNQKEPLSNLKAVIKPTWTKQRSTEISWNFTTVCTHAEGYERLLLSCLTAETRLSLLDKFLTRTPWFFWPLSNGGTFGRWVQVSRLDFHRKYSQNEKQNLKNVSRLAEKGWKTKFLAFRVV